MIFRLLAALGFVCLAASAQAAEPAPSAAPARLNEVPHHAPFKPASPANVNVNGPAQNAPAAKQQKRAIY